MGCVLAANVAANLKVVQAVTDPELTNKGTFGDPIHTAGSGDHTCWSTHRGKFGYPTQGEIHAQDIGAPDWVLDLLETFIRRSWRRGELRGLKYLNVLNRHWNIQTEENWRAAVAGTLQPRYSGDHHAHISYENGAVESDLLTRFFAWVAAGQKFPDQIQAQQAIQEEPEMELGDTVYLPITPVLGNTKSISVEQALAYTRLDAAKAAQGVARIEAAVVQGNAADETRDAALMAAFQSIAAGSSGNLDTVVVVNAIREETERTRQAIVDAAAADLHKIATALTVATASLSSTAPTES